MRSISRDAVELDGDDLMRAVESYLSNRGLWFAGDKRVDLVVGQTKIQMKDASAVVYATDGAIDASPNVHERPSLRVALDELRSDAHEIRLQRMNENRRMAFFASDTVTWRLVRAVSSSSTLDARNVMEEEFMSSIKDSRPVGALRAMSVLYVGKLSGLPLWDAVLKAATQCHDIAHPSASSVRSFAEELLRIR